MEILELDELKFCIRVKFKLSFGVENLVELS